ncbi:MAG: hypothetical protein ABIO70_13285 [Pseudomonadota bacterium]
MKRLPFVLALGALVGCGYDFETFSDDFLIAVCDKLAECEVFTDDYTKDDCLNPEEIEDTSGAEEWVCEEFDGDMAQTCIDNLTAATCDDYATVLTSSECTSYCSNL